MKLRFYIDAWPGVHPTAYTAFQNPSMKKHNGKRFAFDVYIPDQLLMDVDAVLPEVGKVELVEDHNSDDYFHIPK